MDQKTVTTVLKAFFVVAALAASASADPDQQPPCNSFMSVLSCQSATMSESAMPSPACCAALQKFHDADCLCQVLLSARSAAATANVPFNLKAALEIPMKCALRTVSAPRDTPAEAWWFLDRLRQLLLKNAGKPSLPR